MAAVILFLVLLFLFSPSTETSQRTPSPKLPLQPQSDWDRDCVLTVLSLVILTHAHLVLFVWSCLSSEIRYFIKCRVVDTVYINIYIYIYILFLAWWVHPVHPAVVCNCTLFHPLMDRLTCTHTLRPRHSRNSSQQRNTWIPVRHDSRLKASSCYPLTQMKAQIYVPYLRLYLMSDVFSKKESSVRAMISSSPQASGLCDISRPRAESSDSPHVISSHLLFYSDPLSCLPSCLNF